MTDSHDIQMDINSKTHWHRLLAQAVEEPLTAVGIVVQTEIDVTSGSPKADIILLRREGAEWTEAQKAWLTDGMRDTMARELLLEFKFTESLTEDVIAQLFVDGHLYRNKRKLGSDDLKSFLLLSKTPNTGILERFWFVQTDKAGVYASGLPLFDSLGIILLNELPDVPHNAIWKCFASRDQEWQKAFKCVDRYRLSNTSLQHEYVMFGIRSIRMKGALENLEPIGLTPEYVMDLGRREWFASVARSMSKEELSNMPGAEGLRQEGKVDILVRLLTRRFGELPAAVHEKIAVADSGTLEQWVDLVLDARSLADVFGSGLLGTH
ncbi:MAG: DUF4351 domain-containing protein [Magnetococcales bacterium]|nr:DUF4351 domain-containing protein [Magnetococcales bacterium]